MSADDSSAAVETEAPLTKDAIKHHDPEAGGDEEVNSKRKAESPAPADSDTAAKRQKKETPEDEPRDRSRDADSPASTRETRPSPKDTRNSGPRSPGANSRDDSRRDSANSPPDRRKAFAQEEKKRGQRLFGGLLSTLNRTGGNSQQKKRLEIERRQQERANNQRLEDDKRRAERLAKLKHSREIQQITFDEQVMQTRHATMLSQARSLKTRSRPEIYYRPWEPTESQERIILKQVKDAKDAIADEIEQFKIQKAKRLADLGIAAPPVPRDEPKDEPMKEPFTDEPAGEREDDKSNPPDADKSIDPADDKAQHDDKEVMLETEEDTVIY